MFDKGLEAILFPSFDGISVVACGAFANISSRSFFFFSILFSLSLAFHSSSPMMSLHGRSVARLADDNKCVIKYDCVKQS